MAPIRVHEFITLDGVIEAPTWTFDYGFDPAAGAAIARIMGSCDRILLGRTTYEMFEPAWSTRTAEQDPGAPLHERHAEVRRLVDAHRADVAQL